MRVRITAEIRIEKQNLIPQNPDDDMKKALFERIAETREASRKPLNEVNSKRRAYFG